MAVEMEVACLDEPTAAHLASVPAHVHALGARKSKYGRSPALLAWLRENVSRFDGVIVNGIWTYSGLAVCKTAPGRTPYAVFTHGMLDPWFRKRYPLKHVKKCIYWPVQYRVLRQADAVLFTTQLECDLATKSFWPHSWNSVVVPYGTSPPPGTQADLDAQRTAFEQALPQLRGRRFVLYLSRIHEKKGCDLLVDAFARVASEYSDVDLVVAGPDQMGLQVKLQEQAKALGIAARVHWPGMLTGATKWGTMRAAEAFILPSHQENFGIVVAEALACGKPVLISNQVNVWPAIEEDRVGFVAADTLAGTEELLRSWLSLSAADQRAIWKRTVRSFEARFSMRNAAARILQLFEAKRQQ